MWVHDNAAPLSLYLLEEPPLCIVQVAGWVPKILPLPGFDSPTMQPVVGRYTCYANLGHIQWVSEIIFPV